MCQCTGTRPSGGLEEEQRGDLWTEDTDLSWCVREEEGGS